MASGALATSATGVKSLTASYGGVGIVIGVVVCVDGLNSSVYPSGLALATALPPIVPPAPGRLSTTKVWPICSVNFCASIRPTTSSVPPGGNGMIMVIGLVRVILSPARRRRR